jgi:hypothetical protein
MKRDGIALLLLVFIVACLNDGMSAFVAAAVKVIGCYIAIVVALHVLRDAIIKKPSNKEKINNVINAVERREKFSPNTISYRTTSNRLEAQYGISEPCLDHIQNAQLFAIKIRALAPTFVGEFPAYLYLISEKKALYELVKKHGSTYTSLLPKPTVTKDEILRPLEANEIVAFHQFCKEHTRVS